VNDSLIIAPGALLRLTGGLAGTARLQSSAGIRNGGTIELTSADVTELAALVVAAPHTLLNTPSGTILSAAGAGGARQITAALEKLSVKKIDVTKREDPALLGGVVAKVGDVVYDGSLRTQLRSIRDELTK